MPSDLQIGRDLMACAEQRIAEALSRETPGQAASAIFQFYTLLSSQEEREAFVAVLGTSLAIRKGEHLGPMRE